MIKLWSFWSALPSWVHVSIFLVSLYYIASQSVVYVEAGYTGATIIHEGTL